MKLFKISQTENDWYDTYDCAIVAAPDEETARNMNPAGGDEPINWSTNNSEWCSTADQVTVEYLGIAVKGTKQKIICASYNPG